MSNFKKVVLAADMHYPHHDKKSFKALLKFLKEYQPQCFIAGGDMMNHDAINHWLQEKGRARVLEGRRIKKEYDGFQEKIINPLEEVLGSATKYYLKGNHDGEWVERAIDKNPQGEGYWEIENNLDLRKWTVKEHNDVLELNDHLIFHGMYANKYNARKTVEAFEHNVIYFHTHTYQVYTKSTQHNHEIRVGTSLPCLCNMNPEYSKNRPNRWVQGFGILENKNLYPVIIRDGEFSYQGTCFKG